MVADLLALVTALIASPTPTTPEPKHRGVIVTGYPTRQKVIGSEADLHPDDKGIDGIYMGTIFEIRLSEIRLLTGKRLPFERNAPIKIMIHAPPKITSHMLLLVDLAYPHLIGRWWEFTDDIKYACIPTEILKEYTLDQPIRHMYRNDDGDLCLKG